MRFEEEINPLECNCLATNVMWFLRCAKPLVASSFEPMMSPRDNSNRNKKSPQLIWKTQRKTLPISRMLNFRTWNRISTINSILFSYTDINSCTESAYLDKILGTFELQFYCVSSLRDRMLLHFMWVEESNIMCLCDGGLCRGMKSDRRLVAYFAPLVYMHAAQLGLRRFSNSALIQYNS